MDIETGVALIVKAFQEQNKQRCWDLYVTRYAWMTEETFVSFEDFYKESKPVEQEPIDHEKVMNDVKEILDSFRKGKR